MNWLLQNLPQRARHAFQNPSYALRSFYREVTSADERFLAGLTGTTTCRLRSFLGEPIQTRDFAACLRRAETDFRSNKIQSADLYAKKVLLQYAALRAIVPEVVVETGVANGVSSAYLLLALQKNGRGRLHSIEIGDPQYLPAGKSPGWIVPEELRSRWSLLTGDSRELLPRLLVQLGTIDVFIHDSLHTHEQMLWEFRAAYPHLRAGGLLFSDDATWNTAFAEFSREVAERQAQVLRGVGFLRKESP